MVNLSRENECYFEMKVGGGLLKTIRDFEELIEQTTPPMFGSANNSF